MISDIHKAVRALYPSAVSIKTESNELIEAFDANGNLIQIDIAAINSWSDPYEYKSKRAAEYPDFRDYLDGIVKGDQSQMDAYIGHQRQ
ncbi:MAG: hypothetical protein EBX40_07185 [Gammaproteobacteria bacterium]|nr:hypothetical protein [Gammaproteobacteria bacterium]